ncbi:hypothetical protein M433DRAFT_2890 [Acidomyces richmondensis BFW]|nr:MAG: hypothetical protein FE78DRAFT_29147 [Acidomyces sp. 'richmondensis']KYG47373.1 hypothetical protein M433DRAFT_2890 [Acidomyces richmondensis BFW]
MASGQLKTVRDGDALTLLSVSTLSPGVFSEREEEDVGSLLAQWYSTETCLETQPAQATPTAARLAVPRRIRRQSLLKMRIDTSTSYRVEAAVEGVWRRRSYIHTLLHPPTNYIGTRKAIVTSTRLSHGAAARRFISSVETHQQLVQRPSTRHPRISFHWPFMCTGAEADVDALNPPVKGRATHRIE